MYDIRPTSHQTCFILGAGPDHFPTYWQFLPGDVQVDVITTTISNTTNTNTKTTTKTTTTTTITTITIYSWWCSGREGRAQDPTPYILLLIRFDAVIISQCHDITLWLLSQCHDVTMWLMWQYDWCDNVMLWQHGWCDNVMLWQHGWCDIMTEPTMHCNALQCDHSSMWLMII